MRCNLAIKENTNKGIGYWRVGLFEEERQEIYERHEYYFKNYGYTVSYFNMGFGMQISW